MEANGAVAMCSSLVGGTAINLHVASSISSLTKSGSMANVQTNLNFTNDR